TTLAPAIRAPASARRAQRRQQPQPAENDAVKFETWLLLVASGDARTGCRIEKIALALGGLQIDGVAGPERVAGARYCSDVLTRDAAIHLGVRAGRLHHYNLRLHAGVSNDEILGTHADNDVSSIRLPIRRSRQHATFRNPHASACAGANEFSGQEIHRRGPDEAGDKQIGGLVV